MGMTSEPGEVFATEVLNCEEVNYYICFPSTKIDPSIREDQG